MTTYEKIKELCEKEGFSISALSQNIPGLSVNKASITGWKNGSKPRPDKMKAIADYFGVSVEWLQGTSEQKEKPLPEPEELKENEIIIRGRDGSCVRKVLTPEQIQAFKTMVDSLPDAPDDI